MLWPNSQDQIDYLDGIIQVVDSLPKVADEHIRLNTILVDTKAKKTYVVTGVAADGRLTTQQIGAWA